MKQFLAVYLGTPKSMSKWDKLPAKTRQERYDAGFAAWHAWAKKHRKSIVDSGAPLGATRKVSKRGISKVRNELTAYTVVKARNHQAAARMFKDHPHYMFFPGDSIEIMECLPIPME